MCTSWSSVSPFAAAPVLQFAGPARQSRLGYTGVVTDMSSSAADAVWWRRLTFEAFQP